MRPPVFRSPAQIVSAAQPYEQQRGTARERGYDARWDKASKAHLSAHPLCVYCALNDNGRVTAAVLVDHLYPHRGDRDLFWQRQWWASSCKPCHDGFKQALERQGRRALADLARRLGLPVLQG